MAQCPICSAVGEDLVFKFYCSNLNCQNFYKSCQVKENKITDDVTEILRSMWLKYGEETEEEFSIKFFSQGGKFSLDNNRRGIDRIRITEPEWFRTRKARINNLKK